MRFFVQASVLCLALTLPPWQGAVAQMTSDSAEAADSAPSAPQKDLTVVSWGGNYTRSQMLAYVKPFRDHIGEWVVMETYNGGLDELRDQVATENVEWDVIDFELSDLIRGCSEGLLEPVDHGSLPAGEDGTPASEDFIEGALTECGIGQTIYATVVGYNNAQFGDAGPTQIADFFDVANFPGKRGLRRDPRVIMEWALIADGVAPEDVYATLETEEGQAQAFAKMDDIKPHLVVVVGWRRADSPAGFRRRGHDLGLERTHVPADRRGRQGLHHPLGRTDLGYRFLGHSQGHLQTRTRRWSSSGFATGSKPLADQAKYISYGPARSSSMALIADEVKPMLPTTPENSENALQTDAAWWAEHQDELTQKFEAWLAGGGRGLAGSAR